MHELNILKLKPDLGPFYSIRCHSRSVVRHICRPNSGRELMCGFLANTIRMHRQSFHGSFHDLDAVDTIRYDTIGEFNVDWKAEYSALSSTRSQKKKLKQTTPVPL